MALLSFMTRGNPLRANRFQTHPSWASRLITPPLHHMAANGSWNIAYLAKECCQYFTNLLPTETNWKNNDIGPSLLIWDQDSI